MLTIGLPYLKEVIMKRDGKLVIRPDSGDPVEVVRGVVVHNMPHTTSDIIGGEYKAEDSISDTGCNYTETVDSGDEATYYVRSLDGDILEIKAYVSRDYDRTKYIESYDAEVVELTAEQKGAVHVLWELFGGETTSTGHMLL